MSRQHAPNASVRSWLALFACNLMWALQFTCIKLTEAQVGPLATVWIPTTLSTLMLWPIVHAEQKSARLNTTTPRQQLPRRQFIRLYLLLVLLGVVPGQLLMTIGTRYSLASNAALITLALPVATALFAVLFLKERMNGTRWMSFSLALAGVLLTSAGTLYEVHFNSSQLLGNLLVFLAILGSGFYNSYGKKALEHHSPIEMLFWTYLCLVVCMAPFVFAMEPETFVRFGHFTRPTWTGLALLTFFHTFLAMVLFLKALKHLDAIQTALSNYLIPLFGIPIATIWLGEKLTPASIAGGMLILVSTVLMALLDNARKSA